MPLKIIERRRCQNCGATLIMTGIEPIGLGTDRRTFECDQCGHEEELVVNSNYNSTLSAGLGSTRSDNEFQMILRGLRIV